MRAVGFGGGGLKRSKLIIRPETHFVNAQLPSLVPGGRCTHTYKKKCSIARIVRTIVVFLLASSFKSLLTECEGGYVGGAGCYEKCEQRMKDMSTSFLFFLRRCRLLVLLSLHKEGSVCLVGLFLSFFFVFVFEKFGFSVVFFF